MNLEQAVQTITKRGFTVRQAQFLILVARHSGVCVMRQYSSFAGIVFGQKTRKFFAKLVRLGFVSTYDCAHGRGRVYHVRHRAIYEAIGEPDSRLRRPPGVPRALERLMLLDAILREPGQRLDVVPRREGGLLLEARNREPTTARIGPSGKAINGRFGTSPIACRSASIHPATSSSFTCMPTRCATSSATSSSGTRRSSSASPRGRFASWFHRTWRTRPDGSRRSRGDISHRR